jgi:hypothetical protein
VPVRLCRRNQGYGCDELQRRYAPSRAGRVQVAASAESCAVCMGPTWSHISGVLPKDVEEQITNALLSSIQVSAGALQSTKEITSLTISTFSC